MLFSFLQHIASKGENHMSNKFEKHGGFEDVNIKTSQTPIKSKQAYYALLFLSLLFATLHYTVL